MKIGGGEVGRGEEGWVEGKGEEGWPWVEGRGEEGWPWVEGRGRDRGRKMVQIIIEVGGERGGTNRVETIHYKCN